MLRNSQFVDAGLDVADRNRRVGRPGLNFWVSFALGFVSFRAAGALWRWRLTLLLLAVIAFAFYASSGIGWFVLFVTTAPALIGIRMKDTPFKYFTIYHPVYRDLTRNKRKRYQRMTRELGSDWLVQTGICSPAQIEQYRPRVIMEESADEKSMVFRLEDSIPGIPTSKVIERSDDHRAVWDAVRIVPRPLASGGVEITFYTNDPLDESRTITQPAHLDPEDMQVVCATNSSGEDQSITFGDSSGMVVGGVPGSGKTAGMTSFLLPLALSPHVDLHIIDGKGGSDWQAYGPRAKTYIRGDEDLAPIRDFLKEFHGGMVDRLDNQQAQLGRSNFWSVKAEERTAAGYRFKLLVIDECQGIFETSGRYEKADKQMLGEILRYCSAIVKRGRSAGYFVIFATQKPTAEALPTAVRDNCGLRVAFRLTTSEAERAVLGSLPDDSTVHATTIPSKRKGGAVLAKDTGELDYVRFYYMDESEQNNVLRQLPGVEDEEVL